MSIPLRYGNLVRAIFLKCDLVILVSIPLRYGNLTKVEVNGVTYEGKCQFLLGTVTAKRGKIDC